MPPGAPSPLEAGGSGRAGDAAKELPDGGATGAPGDTLDVVPTGPPTLPALAILRRAGCEGVGGAVGASTVVAGLGFDIIEGCELATVAAFKPTVTTPGLVVVVVPDEAAVDGRMIRRGVWICAAALGAEAGAFALLYDACVVVWNGGCISRGSTDRMSTTHLLRSLT